MVELLPLTNSEDIAYVKGLLEEFVEKTGSLIAKDLLMLWPEPTTRFVKVYSRFANYSCTIHSVVCIVNW